jgi:hypothetical protein
MKRVRFFCEHCGREVKANARVCPYCGRFFRLVQCPKCGYTDRGEEFVRGCPSCGYLGTLEPADPSSQRAPSSARDFRSPKTTPGWVWTIALVGLVGALVGAIAIYLSL